MATRGGQRLNRFIRTAKRAKSVRSIEVGFFSNARYPSGEYVAAIAAIQEFGSEKNNIPERPFIRNSLQNAKEELLPIMIQNVDPKTMAVDRRVGGLMGQAMVGRIQRSITTLRKPANAPSTIIFQGKLKSLD